jgi:hypothetical protein
MKRSLCLSALVILLLSIPITGLARNRQEAAITAENQFTTAITVKGSAVVYFHDSGSFSGTITLQVSRDGGSTWVDVENYTSETVKAITYGGNMMWRIGCKTGGYTSGSATVALQQD